MSIPLFWILSAALLPTQEPKTPDSKGDHRDEHFVERVDEIAREAVAKEGVPGLSICVSRDGEVLISKGYGYADAKKGEPASPETAYSIGTLSRTFTATAILQLVDQGKLSLDDELGKLLPGFPTQGQTVRLRHLLTDSSGLPSLAKLFAKSRNEARATPASAGKDGKRDEKDAKRDSKDAGEKPPKKDPDGAARTLDPALADRSAHARDLFAREPQDEKTRDAAKPGRETSSEKKAEEEPDDPARRAAETAALYELFRAVPFAFAPGSARDEDNSGWLVLSMVLAQATGEDYARVIRTRILEPLELSQTVFCPVKGGRTQGFADDCLTPSDEQDVELPGARTPLQATRSLCSTVGDLDRWQRAIHARELLSEESTRLLLAAAAPSQQAERAKGEGTKEKGQGGKEKDEKEKDEKGKGNGRANDKGEKDGKQEEKSQATSSDGGPYRFRSRSGVVTGFQSHVAYYPDARVSIVVLANCANAPVDRIETAVARLVVGLMPPDVAIGDLPLDAEDIARYAGRYQIATTLVRVFERDGKLWFETPTQPTFRLMYQGKHVFVHESEKDTRLVFELEEEGKPATSFKMLRGGTMSLGKRME